MDIHCSDKETDFLKLVGKTAQSMGFPAYLVGGFVRDRILGRPTKDIDINTAPWRISLVFVCEVDMSNVVGLARSSLCGNGRRLTLDFGLSNFQGH